MSAAKSKTKAGSKKESVPQGLFSTTQLHEKFDLDRGTILKRLKTAGITPAYEKPKLKCYRLAQKGRDGRTVREILEEADDTKLTEAKTRKMLVSAEREQFKFDLEQGNYLSRAEVKQFAFEFISAMFKRFVKLNPRQSAPRLFKAKSVAELQRMMETDASLIFQELKRDYPNFG